MILNTIKQTCQHKQKYDMKFYRIYYTRKNYIQYRIKNQQENYKKLFCISIQIEKIIIKKKKEKRKKSILRSSATIHIIHLTLKITCKGYG